MSEDGTTLPVILYIHHGYMPGGAPTSLRNLVHGIAGREFAHCIVGCMHSSMLDFFAKDERIEVVSYPKSGLVSGRVFIAMSPLCRKNIFRIGVELLLAPVAVWREINAIRKLSPAIVHLNSAILWTSAIAAACLGKPLVWHIREASGGRSLLRSLYACFIRKIASHVICIGPREYSILAGDKHANVHEIRNSLDDSFFESTGVSRLQARRELRIPDDKFVFVSLGGSSFRKGALQLLHALKELPSRFYLLLAGPKLPPPRVYPRFCWHTCLMQFENWLCRHGYRRCIMWYYSERLSLAQDRIDGSRMSMTGVLDDVKPAIVASDVLVFAGTTPHSGRPLYEAWALGKPVIVFDSEVMRQEVVDGETGIIVREHTGKALADALLRLSNDPRLSEKLGRNGYERAMSLFSLEKNTNDLIDVYRKIFDAN